MKMGWGSVIVRLLFFWCLVAILAGCMHFWPAVTMVALALVISLILIQTTKESRKPRGRPWRGHGRLRLGVPTKRKDEFMAFRMEVDEESTVTLPAIVDDDGDPVNVAGVDWKSSDNTVAFWEPASDGLSATLKTTGAPGQISVAAEVRTPDGGVGIYTGQVSVGFGVPVGGELAFSSPVKRA